MAAARARAVEVRKSKAEEKQNLKRELEDNGKLRLESTRIQNEKLRKEVESAKVPKEEGDDDKVKNAKTSEAPKEDKEGDAKKAPIPPPSAGGDGADNGPNETDNESDDDLDPHPLQYVADRIDRMSAMFEEELNYKRQKREAKAKAPAPSHKAFAAHNNYMRAMETNTRVMGNSSLF